MVVTQEKRFTFVCQFLIQYSNNNVNIDKHQILQPSTEKKNYNLWSLKHLNLKPDIVLHRLESTYIFNIIYYASNECK